MKVQVTLLNLAILLPSNHDDFLGSVVLKDILWRSSLSSATNTKLQLPTLSIGYCINEEKVVRNTIDYRKTEVQR